LYAKEDSETIGVAPLSELNNEHLFKIKKINGSNRVGLITYLNTYLTIAPIFRDSPKKILKQKELTKLSISNSRELFLVHNINTNTDNEGFEFNISRKLRFIKITPMGSYGLCNMKLELFEDGTNLDILKKLRDQNINIKASSCFKFRNGELTKDKINGQYCRYGGYNTDKLNRFSDGGWMMSDKDSEGSAFIVYDNLREGLIKGGIMYTRNDYNDSCSSCDNYVKKFKVQIAGNNKIFRDIGEHTTNFNSTRGKDLGFKFEIMKNNVRFVKIVLLSCNNKCSMRLDFF
jgi:hypothetical protein